MIWMNLISIPIEKGIAGEENSLTEKDVCQSVISSQRLDKFFSLEVPEDIRNDKRRLKVWNANVSRFKQHYYGYCHSVCGENLSWNAHQERWESFERKLTGKYCLHH